MRKVPECQNNKNRCSWMILYQSVWYSVKGCHYRRGSSPVFSRPDLFIRPTNLPVSFGGSPQTSRMFGCFDLYKAMASSVSLKEWIAKDAKVKSPKSVVVSLFTSNFNPSPFFIGSAIAINLPRASHKRKPPWEPDGSARSKAWRIWSRRTKAPGEDLENQELWASSHSWEDGCLVWIFSKNPCHIMNLIISTTLSPTS